MMSHDNSFLELNEQEKVTLKRIETSKEIQSVEIMGGKSGVGSCEA